MKALPVDVVARHPDVDRKGFAGLRDMVAHQYLGLNTRQLLPIIQNEVPALLVAVETELTRV